MTIDASRVALLNGLPKESVGAEIGVYKGNFSEAILSIVKPRKLHLIDPWKLENEEAYSDSLYGVKKGVDQANMDLIYQSVQQRFANEIQSDSVNIHRSSSSEAASLFEDDYFDWVYIDGNHLYEYVKDDLEQYYGKVKVGGYLACDDYGLRGWWDDGVLKATHEFLVNHQCKVAFVSGCQFVIQKTA